MSELVAGLEQRCHSSRQRRVEEGKDPLGFVGYIDDDTYVTTESFDVALRAAAAWIRAVDVAMAGSSSNAATTTTSSTSSLPVFASIRSTWPTRIQEMQAAKILPHD